MDLVITVCDNAAGEVCPYWPGQPATAHWSYADPSAVEGSDDDRLQAFRDTLYLIQDRLQLVVDVPADELHKAKVSRTAKALSQEHA